MTKHEEYFDKMIKLNKTLFDRFSDLHRRYSLNQEELQDEFNSEGEKIIKIIKEWENKLCSQSEKAGYSRFTQNLSEKFWSKVKEKYPLIDNIGIIVKKRPIFNIKKINL